MNYKAYLIALSLATLALAGCTKTLPTESNLSNQPTPTPAPVQTTTTTNDLDKDLDAIDKTLGDMNEQTDLNSFSATDFTK